MSARSPDSSKHRCRRLVGSCSAWLALGLLAGSCLNPSPDELPQATNDPGSLPRAPAAQPADSAPVGATASTAPAAPANTPSFAPAPATPPATQGAPFAPGASEPSDAGTADADAPDAE